MYPCPPKVCVSRPEETFFTGKNLSSMTDGPTSPKNSEQIGSQHWCNGRLYWKDFHHPHHQSVELLQGLNWNFICWWHLFLQSGHRAGINVSFSSSEIHSSGRRWHPHYWGGLDEQLWLSSTWTEFPQCFLWCLPTFTDIGLKQLTTVQWKAVWVIKFTKMEITGKQTLLLRRNVI